MNLLWPRENVFVRDLSVLYPAATHYREAAAGTKIEIPPDGHVLTVGGVAPVRYRKKGIRNRTVRAALEG